MRHLAEPESRNIFGSVHGGWIMRQIDQAAYVCAARHAGCPAVTASIDRIDFRSPIHVGDLVTLTASVWYVGRTSMVIGVRVEAEDLLSGEIRHSNSAMLTFVAIDAEFRPVPVPGLIRETPEEERRWQEVHSRRDNEGR
jgi:acyl-CoA hydrolase